MIKSLSLKNFQAHSQTTLNLSPGVNAIVGNSDEGKSTLFRALYWLVNNRPAGDEFIRYGEDQTAVTLVTEEGDTVTRFRRRGGGQNGYTLNGEAFAAIGTGVPPEIAGTLNLGEINLQPQLAGPYLLGDSPAAVARYLNQLVDLDAIDHSVQSIRSTLNEETGALRNARIDLEQAETTLAQYDWVTHADGKLTGLECQLDKLIRLAKKTDVVRGCLLQLRDTQKEIEQLTPARQALGDLDRWETLRSELDVLNNEAEVMDGILDELAEIRRLTELKQPVRNLFDYCDELIPLITKRQELAKRLAAVKRETDGMTNDREEHRQLFTDYQHRRPAECPVCGGPME